MSDQAPVETGVGDLAREAAVEIAGPSGDGERPTFQRRQAYITAISSDWLTCSIKFPESTDPIPGIRFMHQNHPHVGDTVWVDQNGPDTIVSSLDAVPVGFWGWYPVTTAPKGWLAMNGQSTAGYPKLAALYGANLPNMDGIFPVGGGGAYALGSTGGVATRTDVATHAHTQPAHRHVGPDHDHAPGGHVHGLAMKYAASEAGGYGLRSDDDGFGDRVVVDNTTGGGMNSGGPSQSGFTALGGAILGGSAGNENTGNAGVASVENRPPYRAFLAIVKHD